MARKDYYAILGVAPSASEGEIRVAYRRLARRYHPDLHPEREDGDARLKELNEAYEVLANPERRARYAAEVARVQVHARPTPPPRARPSRAAPGPPWPTGDSWARQRPRGTHVDLSGGGVWRPSGTVGREPPGPWAVDPAADRRALDELELLLWQWRRLLRALTDW